MNNPSKMDRKGQIKRDKKGRFVKGSIPNPKGRTPGTDYVGQLHRALKKAEIEKDKSFLEHLIERAYRSDRVAVALAKKLLPDKMQQEGMLKDKQIIIITQDGNNRKEEIARK